MIIWLMKLIQQVTLNFQLVIRNKSLEKSALISDYFLPVTSLVG